MSNYSSINQNYGNMQRTRENERINEVARIAGQIQQREKCTRTEALRIAERMVPHA